MRIAELLFIIIAAALLGPRLTRHILLMVGDNQNAQARLATFKAGIPCVGAGRYGFAIRALPYRRELVNKFQLRKTTWWAGGDETPISPPPTVDEMLGVTDA